MSTFWCLKMFASKCGTYWTLPDYLWFQTVNHFLSLWKGVNAIQEWIQMDDLNSRYFFLTMHEHMPFFRKKTIQFVVFCHYTFTSTKMNVKMIKEHHVQSQLHQRPILRTWRSKKIRIIENATELAKGSLLSHT